jgi:Membrane bound O-acyl transferase family
MTIIMTLINYASSHLPGFPDASLRRPLTLLDIALVILSYYAHAVMAMLPGTFWLRVTLLPFTLWLAWSSAVTLDLAQYLASALGDANPMRFTHLNFAWVVSSSLFKVSYLLRFNDSCQLAMFVIALKSFEWTFIIKDPIRRYEMPKEGQQPPKVRPLTVANIFFDASDLLFNHRGLGWSWSSEPFPRNPDPPPSISRQFLNLLLKVTAFDAAHYIVELIRPSLSHLEGDTVFDETLDLLPRLFLVSSISFCGTIVIYSSVEVMYQVCALFGQIVLGQSAAQWPPIADRPWMSTSVTEFWGKRWHQFFRHLFVLYGARPGRKIAGWYGSIMGVYVVSAVMHVLGLWGVGNGTEFTHTGGFFIMIGLGSILERKWKQWTGKEVTGVFGMFWAVTWQLIWGSRMVDAWTRRGIVANDFLPEKMRIGKTLVSMVLTVVARVWAA